LRGIVGECGGSAMCATCHVYVDEVFVKQLPAPLETELEMLECTASDCLPNSRLSCQIKISAVHEGLVVRLPERQQ
jgi:2Fe-2S ferredoxin